ncbi:MAG TPA: TetR/AcrR family transcriptional regulator [Solirubrobacteraceae bacterium]
MPRDAVVHHQRTRIHGAMIEAVADVGYERTSVKQVIGLAGVSRRSFYELFANRQECFLATFDVVAARQIQCIANAYLASDGGLAERLDAVYEAFVEEATQNPKAATLALLDAQTAGAPGTLRLRRATTICERMLARSFADAGDAASLPAPIVRGITGGLHGAIGSALSGSEAPQRELSDQMLRWTLSFQTPRAERMDELMSARLRQRMREISLASAAGAGGPPQDKLARDERGRLLHEVLRLAARHDYRELSGPQIADEARLPVDAFLEHFASRDECYLAALEMIGEELLSIAGDAELGAADWPAAVRRMLAALLSHLGAHPLYARTIAQEAFAAGSEPMQRALVLTDRIAELLTDAAPATAGSAFAVQGIAGALMHTVRCQVLGGRVEMLGVLSDHLSYLVLAPFIGADAALAAICEDAAT